MAAHEVTNQVPPLENIDLFASDPVLQSIVVHRCPWAVPWLEGLGKKLGRAEMFALADRANRHVPILHTFDRWGRRRDEVEFDAAWHSFMELAVSEGLHSMPWLDSRAGAHAARAAAFYMYGQVENGTQCPLTMTYGAIPVLRAHPGFEHWERLALAREYDRRFLPSEHKRGVILGMGMTEKQGGSDVRSNTTSAERRGDGSYGLTGHKWFLSAPMCDAFFIVARTSQGPSCFLVPQWLPDGTRNALRFQRLKDKLGNRSNASSEVEFDDADAQIVGTEGRGIPTILQMGNYTRLDCALGTAGMMRRAWALALHHARHRVAFGKRLIEHPLMRAVLADLTLEWEAATRLSLRLADAITGQDTLETRGLFRLMTPAVKYWVCKQGPAFAAECMEILGGNGYVEESQMPRIYRELPLNSIWEGAGNIMCLDVLRVLRSEPDCHQGLEAELEPARGFDAGFDAWCEALHNDLAHRQDDPAHARLLTERIALALQGALMIRHTPREIAHSFCATRLAGGSGRTFGALSPSGRVDAILERAAEGFP